jgi:hypothetical protein
MNGIVHRFCNPFAIGQLARLILECTQEPGAGRLRDRFTFKNVRPTDGMSTIGVLLALGNVAVFAHNRPRGSHPTVSFSRLAFQRWDVVKLTALAQNFDQISNIIVTIVPGVLLSAVVVVRDLTS